MLKKFKWLQQDLNPQPLSSEANTQPFIQTSFAVSSKKFLDIQVNIEDLYRNIQLKTFIFKPLDSQPNIHQKSKCSPVTVSHQTKQSKR